MLWTRIAPNDVSYNATINTCERAGQWQDCPVRARERDRESEFEMKEKWIWVEYTEREDQV